jgi:hypothetical protein
MNGFMTVRCEAGTLGKTRGVILSTNKNRASCGLLLEMAPQTKVGISF